MIEAHGLRLQPLAASRGAVQTTACRVCGSPLRDTTDGPTGIGRLVQVCDACTSGEPAKWRHAIQWLKSEKLRLERELAARPAGRGVCVRCESTTRELSQLRVQVASVARKCHRCRGPVELHRKAKRFCLPCMAKREAARVRPCLRCHQPLSDARHGRVRLCAPCRAKRDTHPCLRCQAPLRKLLGARKHGARVERLCASCRATAARELRDRALLRLSKRRPPRACASCQAPLPRDYGRRRRCAVCLAKAATYACRGCQIRLPKLRQGRGHYRIFCADCAASRPPRPLYQGGAIAKQVLRELRRARRPMLARDLARKTGHAVAQLCQVLYHMRLTDQLVRTPVTGVGRGVRWQFAAQPASRERRT